MDYFFERLGHLKLNAGDWLYQIRIFFNSLKDYFFIVFFLVFHLN